MKEEISNRRKKIESKLRAARPGNFSKYLKPIIRKNSDLLSMEAEVRKLENQILAGGT